MRGGELQVYHLDDGKFFRGGQRQVIYLAKELGKLGAENTIVCRRNSPLAKAAEKENLKVLHLPYFFEWDIVSAVRLAKHIKKNAKTKTPVVHSHTSHAAAISYLVSLLVPVVRIVHRRVDFKVGKGLSSFLKYAKSGKTIVLSEAIRDILKSRIGEDKISVIPSSIDFDNLPWNGKDFRKYRKTSRTEISRKFHIPPASFWVGSLIALVPHKDPENFLRAAKLISEKHPETSFILAGNGELESRLKKLARKAGMEKNFFIIGHYPNSYELLSALDIFVLPSREEGLGSVLIEAMAAHLPIVATKAGGIPELIKDGQNGLLAEKENPRSLAERIILLLENEKLRSALAENGTEKSLKYSAREMAEKTLKIYEES